MSSVSGFSPASTQASAAIYHFNAADKAPPEARDDVVAPIETTNMQAKKGDVTVLKMNDSAIGQKVDFKV
ncbi:hypothetical protein FHS83_001993 [Rhizomicrobium palustre]|uniref:Uncharacterized protein n=1 Tax=Rhizomicrobium palustre TaxID=189966 RepID=A0A846MZL2_9PROT|nr:hypothetical protein [Rhizomicrobium palustre]NIK88675.1 hypothetical protein [Rhizomicrobium palustre]